MIALMLLAAALWAPSPGQKALDRATRLFAERKMQPSLEAVEEALRLDPKLVPALLLHARLAMAARRNDVARDSLGEAVAIEPQSAAAQFLLGLALFEENELHLAIAPLETARRLDARDPRPVLYLGLVRESLGQGGEALGLYEQAIGMEEDAGTPRVETYLIAARLYLLSDRTEAAAALVDKALRRDKGSRDALFEAARIALRQDQPQRAVAHGESALKAKGGETTAVAIHALLARAYQRLGNTAEAGRHAEAARREESGTSPRPQE